MQRQSEHWLQSCKENDAELSERLLLGHSNNSCLRELSESLTR